MIWSAVGRAIEKFLTTLFFLLFGMLNAQSWAYLPVFGALGAIIDLAPLYLASGRDLSHRISTGGYQQGWRQLAYGAVTFAVLGLAIIWTSTALSSSDSSLIDTMGRGAHSMAAPFIAILRDHYGDLAASGFVGRANLVALVYVALFLLFYITLAFVLFVTRYRFPSGIIIYDAENSGPSQEKWKAIVVILILGTGLLIAVGFTTFMQIDYADDALGRRHINTNLSKYNSFFYDLLFFLGASAFLLPIEYQFLKSLCRRRR